MILASSIKISISVSDICVVSKPVLARTLSVIVDMIQKIKKGKRKVEYLMLY